jgi:hypothetical protein
MARRKGEVRLSSERRRYPYVASFALHWPRHAGGHAAGQAAAAAISGRNYLSHLRRSDSGIEYLFKTAEQAHAMQIWFEAHGVPFDAWQDRRQSHEEARREMKFLDDLVNAAAATGAAHRVAVAMLQSTAAGVELLQEIEPQWRYDKMQAGRIASIIVDCTEAYTAQAEWLQLWRQDRDA